MTFARRPTPTPRSRGALWRVSNALCLLLFLIAPEPARAGGTDRFVVVLEDGVERPRDVAGEHRNRYGAELLHIYSHALNGYAARLSEEAAAAIARDPRVQLVEPDQAISTLGQVVPTGIERIGAPANPGTGIDGRDDVRVDADIAIIDTGVDPDHPDLDVVTSANCIGSGLFGGGCVSGGRDDNGHGTHVAGTAAAIDNDLGVVGVAPGARLHAVKVLAASGDGLMSDVVAGIDWVTSHADTIEVANMSLGCRCTMASLDVAIAGSVEAGIVHVVAAGNQDEDARSYSPAGHPDAITVSALADSDGAPGGQGPDTCTTDQDDTLGDYSNWGPAVDVAAPGTCIYSTTTLGRYATMTGTSMASPHVAGAAALMVSGANDARTRGDVEFVRAAIISSGSSEWTDDSGDGIFEPLLDVGDAEVFDVNSPERTLGSSAPPPSEDPPANQAPVAAFTHSCSGLQCSFDATGSYDSDGTIASYDWDLGDGTAASGPTIQKTFDSEGIYTVTLTVVDDYGAGDSEIHEIEVVSPGSEDPAFTLMGTATRTGSQTTHLYWQGTDLAGDVVIFRNGEAIVTTSDDGTYTDFIPAPSGRYVYKACEANTTRCSNEVYFF